jgi:hypothetical protein
MSRYPCWKQSPGYSLKYPLPSSSQEEQRYSCIWTKWQLLTFDLPMMLIVLSFITSRAEYYNFSNLLRTLGLQESTESGAPLCRWHYEEISIDVMPCDSSVLGFSNRWYRPGIANSIPLLSLSLDDNLKSLQGKSFTKSNEYVYHSRK